MVSDTADGIIANPLPDYPGRYGRWSHQPAIGCIRIQCRRLGTLGAGYMAPDAIRKEIREIRALTNRPFAVNLMVPSSYKNDLEKERRMKNCLQQFERAVGAPHEEPIQKSDYSFADQVNVVLEEKVPVFSFTFGIPEPTVIRNLQSNQTVVIGTATTVREAVRLEQSGVEAIVAQGSEAGGHRGTFLSSDFPSIGTIALVPQVVDHVRIPVIASGGIMDGRGVLASLALGAEGVQMGSAFLTTAESGAHPKHKEALIHSTDESTVMTTAFSGRPARGIKNTFIGQMEHYSNLILPYPVQNNLTKNMRKYAAKQGKIEYMSLWAGQAASLGQLETARELMKRIIEQVHQGLERF